MIAIEEVVDGIVRGIENRSDMVVLPRRNTMVAKAAGLFRPVVERLGFKRAEIKEVIALAGKS
ncbi:hypothetical protein D3C79_973210 [compost metagenome]